MGDEGVEQHTAMGSRLVIRKNPWLQYNLQCSNNTLSNNRENGASRYYGTVPNKLW